MKSKLTWRGYGTHDLDEAAAAFFERTQTQPEFFAVSPKWECSGSEANQGKVIFTTLAGCNGIAIPLDVTMGDFLALVAEREEKKSTAPAHDVSQEEADLSEAHGVSRYCSYCGRLFIADVALTKIHCGSPACVSRHEEYTKHLESIKAMKKTDSADWTAPAPRKPEATTGIDQTPEFTLDDPNRGMLAGSVYFIQAENGLVKIGRSDNIERRFVDLTFMSPVRLYLRHFVAASNYVRAEAWLHSQFAAKHDHGEWYGLSDEDLEWAKSLTDYSLDMV